MNDRRSLSAGVILVLVGVFLLLRNVVVFQNTGSILLLIGAIFFVLSALRSFRGPLLPAGILLGLGAGFLLRQTLEPWLPHWAVLLLGIAFGFLLVAAIDAAAGRQRRPAPLVPGAILLVVVFFAALARHVDLEASFTDLAHLWPWILIVVGVVLIVVALRRRAV